MSSDTPHRWDELNQEQRRKVERYITTLLAEQQPLPMPKVRAGREVVEQRQRGSVWYQLERVKCGKKNCRKCSGGPAHGPYWYAYWREGGRMKSKYVGKELKPIDPTPTEPASPTATTPPSQPATTPPADPATEPMSHHATEPMNQQPELPNC